MEGQLNKAFHLVAQPNNQAIKQGEHLLGLLKKNQTYPIALLHYMNSPSVTNQGKLRAAIELKLWAQSYKDMEEYEQNFYSQVIETIKDSILHAYLNFPPQISKTLLPGIVCLTDVLFPRRWDKLIQFLLSYASQNNQSIGAILQLLQSITYKYTILSRSDPLYEEIIKVCEEAHDYLKDLTTNVLQIVISNPNTKEALILETLMKLFYNLNYQDLHPKYEDNLGHWMNVLKAVMKLPNASEPIFKCKGAALQAILLYSNKYKEDVEQSIKEFCIQIWPLCASASEDQQLDSIVFNCLKFFKSMLNWNDMKPFFQEHMNQFFESLILPNIALNKTASALFEEEPEVFTDYYFRNTEVQTRRSAALQLLRIICRSYNTFQGFLETQITNFMGLPSKNVVAQCTLLGLVIDGSSKGFRDIDGCTQLFVDVKIIEFCYHNIAKITLGNIYSWAVQNPKGLIENRFNALHVATVIRFFFYFRIYFPKEELGSLLQCFAKIRTKSDSLRRAIHLVVNGYLIMKHGDYQNYRNFVLFFNPENLRPVAVDIFTLIYEGTIEDQFLQDGLTKMFLNLTKGLQHLNSQFFSYQLQIMKEMLKRTERFDFNSAQFLFEAIGMLTYYYIRANSPDKAILEKTILDFFQAALHSKSDLLNFCLQVVAIFLQLEQSTNERYLNIYQSLLLEENWKEENQSVMSSYIQYIIAFLGRFRERLVSDRPAIELILSKIIQIDHIDLFFRFLQAIMQNTTLEEFNHSGYMSIFVRGSQALGQSIQGRKATLLFLSRLLVHYGDHITALHMLNNCCTAFYDQLLTASGDILRSISARRDRKFIFLAVCKAIESNYFRNPQLDGTLFDQLISNTVDRFAIRNITNHVQENESKERKEATYRKLQVFKEFEKPEMDPQIDQEELMVRTFRNVGGERGLLQYITDRNRDRIMRLNDKYSK